jgi:hypothetical protein
MKEKQLTAVEWFAQELYEKFEMKGDGKVFDDLLEQAKEMEKQQIIDAFELWRTGSGEKYYNQTFKQQEQ